MAKTTKEEKVALDLTAEQQRVAESLVFSGVSFERQRLTELLSPHRGKAIQVDAMIDIINNIAPAQEQEASVEES